MSLSSLASLRQYLRIQDTSQDDVLVPLLASAERIACLFCKRSFDLGVYVEYPLCASQEKIALRNRPVRMKQIATTMTQGSASVTLAAGGGLVAGAPAVLAGYLPDATTVSTVVSSTSLTLSAAALKSGTQTVTYGLAAWLDAQGGYGQGVNSFGAGTALAAGTDFALEIDQADGSSKCGLLTRWGGGGGGASSLGACGWGWGWGGRRGTLTARRPLVWPAATGTLKVCYAAGYATGDAPAELTLAVNEIAAAVRVMAPVGVPLDVPSVTTQYVELLGAPGRSSPFDPPLIASARHILRAYRELSL